MVRAFDPFRDRKIHKMLQVTPAMEAKLMTKPTTIEGLVGVAYVDEIANEEK